MIGRIFSNEARFDALLCPYRVRADRIMVGMNLFLMLVCLAIAPLRGTYGAALLIGLPTLLVSVWMQRHLAGGLWTRVFMACAFMAYTGLIIHQTGGDIEAHFSAFGLIGVLLYYRDWRTVAAATVFIYLHHLVLGYAQSRGVPVYVFDHDSFWLLFAIHVAYFLPFVGMMGYLSIWLRREGYEAQHVIELAQRITQGNLIESDTISTTEHEMPLITAVLAMKNRLLDLLRVMPVPAAVIRIDTETIVSINNAWTRTLGPQDDASMRFRDSPIWAEPGTWETLLARLHEAQNQWLQKVEVPFRMRDGQPLLCELSLILHADVNPVMAILTVEDITQRRLTEQAMNRLAYRDMLTDLPNRASLHGELQRALKLWQLHAVPFALVLLDLDGFKPINDQHGHDAGDDVLKVIGARLLAMNRESDLSARLGGDEFAVVLSDCSDAATAAQIAQRFVENLSRPIRLLLAGQSVQVGTSIGVAHIQDGPSEIDALMKNADRALYAAKAAGKNRVSVYRAGGQPADQGRAGGARSSSGAPQ